MHARPGYRPGARSFRQHAFQSFFDQGPERHLPLTGKLFGLLKKVISNIYGCFHVGNKMLLS